MVGPLEDTGELDLAEATRGHHRRRAHRDRRVGEHHLGHRARGVRHHDRMRSLTAAGPRELAVVGALPTVDDEHIVVAQRRPVGLPTLFSELGTVASRTRAPVSRWPGFSTTVRPR
jgi:hypothetical protein